MLNRSQRHNPEVEGQEHLDEREVVQRERERERERERSSGEAEERSREGIGSGNRSEHRSELEERFAHIQKTSK